MIKILVIGNGFDKAHGLKTGYGDFLDWFNIMVSGEEYWMQSHHTKLSKERERIRRNFDENHPQEYEFCLNEENNFWISHFNKVRTTIGDKWLNFETEIEFLTKQLYSYIDENGLKGIGSRLQNQCIRKVEIPEFVNINEVFEWLHAQLRQMTRVLEIYLCVYANGASGKDDRIELFTEIKANKLLSFNYTSTYQRVYNQAIPKIYIHGRAILEQKDCNLVLGYDDHYFETNETIPELIPFEKYYQRIVYRNSNDYFNWLEQLDKNGNSVEKEIHFFGHSLSPADGDIIKLLIEAENTKTKIYYRKVVELERANMIRNLAIILTPNGLIKRMNGANPTIEFIPV